MSDEHGAFLVDGRFFQRRGGRAHIQGITYGPFAEPLDVTDWCRRDLDDIAGLGFNALRVYERPSKGFLAACEERGLAVFVSLKWESNTDFLGASEEVMTRLEDDVMALRDAAGISGYFIANEIRATVVRWMGWGRVRAFLEAAFRRVRKIDPTRLYAYANYPSTEYLQPRNEDFTAFNIYLEERDAMRRYLRRLHHHAGDRPLVISEYGFDSVSNGELLQADTVSWLAEEIFASGAAGAFLFSYTDDWFNGGRQMTDWGFGIVSADRRPKPSAARMAATLRKAEGWDFGLEISAWPLVSVIVCTHNGHAFLGACLDCLARTRYPNQEVLVIDDGSRPGIEALVEGHPGMRYIRQDHAGLSAARNRGVAESRGEIIAFTDDDCEPDPEWLVYLVKEILTEEVDACGGPNIATKAESLMERCIQLAPGNPAHVMLDDFRAEHLPGCNLAVTREAFEAVGGFGEHYRFAGDDVDFCWRLQFEGRRLGFAPTAFVWHHRRRTWYSFFCQQVGYGRAEALLHWDHPQRYGGLGGTDWKGTVYSQREVGPVSRPVIYYGRDGLAPFQAIYDGDEGGAHGLAGGVRSMPWIAGMVVAFLVGLGISLGLWVGLVMLLCSLGGAFLSAWNLCLPEGASRWRVRALLTWLHWSPVVGRHVARRLHAGPVWWHRGLGERRVAFWSTAGVGREAILSKMRSDLGVADRWPGSGTPNQWSSFDLVLPASVFAHLVLVSVTEPHEREECLTRVAVRAHLKRWVRAGYVFLGALTAGQLLGGHWGWSASGVLMLAAITGLIYLDAGKHLKAWMHRIEKRGSELGLQRVDP